VKGIRVPAPSSLEPRDRERNLMALNCFQQGPRILVSQHSSDLLSVEHWSVLPQEDTYQIAAMVQDSLDWIWICSTLPHAQMLRK
jgi:hypothetical protein